MIALEEARQHGWKHPQVYSSRLEGDSWVVCVYQRPLTTGNVAFVRIAPDGTVLEFDRNKK
jgi:hypothetical protein